MYRPVYRIKYDTGEVSEWGRLPHPIISLGMNSEEELVLKFDWFFTKAVASVQFAFIYPYSYVDCRRDVETLSARYQCDPEFYFGS